MNYTGQTCPYCSQPFKEDDDIAVCPECGTPHHRSCFKAHGECAFTSKHAEGYVYQNLNEKTSEEDNKAGTENNGKILCSHCGTENEEALNYCKECGWPLNRNNSSTASPYAATERYVTSINLDDKIDGVPIRDYKVYLGKNSITYILAFIRQNKTGGKIGFNFAAVISPVLFFLFYRMWGYAAIMSVLSLILSFPSYVVTLLSTAAAVFGISMAVWQKMEIIASALLFFTTILCGLYSTYLLRVTSNKKIVKIRNSCTTEEEYSKALSKKSCPSKAFIVLLVLFIVCIFTGYFIY